MFKWTGINQQITQIETKNCVNPAACVVVGGMRIVCIWKCHLFAGLKPSLAVTGKGSGMALTRVTGSHVDCRVTHGWYDVIIFGFRLHVSCPNRVNAFYIIECCITYCVSLNAILDLFLWMRNTVFVLFLHLRKI